MALNGWPWVPPVTGPVTVGRATSAPGDLGVGAVPRRRLLAGLVAGRSP